jgi:hypothetical protein
MNLYILFEFLIFINTNYEHYCKLGKSRGLCETEKFPIGCKSECNK